MSLAFEQTFELARRSFLRSLRQPAAVIPSLVFPLFLLAVNTAGLNTATDIPGFPTDSYLSFILAFPFIQGSIFALLNMGTDVATDVEGGLMNRLALTTLPGPALLGGMLGGAMAIGLLQAVVYLAVGLAAGADFAAGVAGVPVLLLLSLTISFAFGCVGIFAALRVGSSEAMQSLFPVFFIFLLLQLSLVAAGTARPGMVPDDRRHQSGLLPDREHSQPLHHRLRRRGARPGLRLRHPDRHRLPDRCGGNPADQAGADVSGLHRFRSVALIVAWRSLHNFLTTPALLLPALIFPLFFFSAFAGGLARIDQAPGFDYSQGYTAFIFAFVLLQASAFGGVFAGFGIARDFETGFGRRLMLAAPNRLAVLAGYAMSALVRALVVGAMLFAIALLTGMEISSDAIEIGGLIGLALLVNAAASMWAAGIALRFRSIQAGPLMQTPVFLVLFLTPVYVPLELLESWIHAVARYNPLTPMVEAGRSLLAGAPEGIGLAVGAGFALLAFFLVWGISGMRKAEAAGG